MLDILSSRKALTGECFDLVWNMTSCQERIYWIRISTKVFPSLGKPGRLQKVAWRRSHVEKDHDQVRRWHLPGNWCQQVFFATISILRLQLLVATSSHRNWDFHWSETGASGDSCSQTYYGPEPFSEVKASLIRTWDFPYLSFLRQVENRNVRDFVSARKDRIVFYQTLHSYSQLILFPW